MNELDGFAERREGCSRADDCGVLLSGMGAGGVGAIVDGGVDGDGDLVVIDDVDKDIVHGLRRLGRQQGDADFGRILVDG